MKKKDWKTLGSIERRLLGGLSRLTARIRGIAKESASLEAIISAVAALTNTREWRALAHEEAKRMVKSTAAQNARTWREAARKSRKGSPIHQALKNEFSGDSSLHHLIEQNAALISSLPLDIARHVAHHAATNTMAGLRSDALLEEIKRQAPLISETRARLIARTETAKAQAAVTEIRAQNLGIQWYIWRTSEDSRVRSSHDIMEGVLCRFDLPPSPEKLDPDNKQKRQHHYGPGGIWNCRCYAEPLIDLDFVRWPAKVYHNGQITRMTRKQFEALSA